MKSFIHRKPQLRLSLFGWFSVFILLCFPWEGFSQEAKVSSEVDTASIQIGEQIRYRILVESAADEVVIFPEAETFNPMEVVESFDPDTTRAQDRLRLLKEYALTQFDSGRYSIPQQRVLVNDREYLTDSILIEVADVEVDTTKQKMFDIKPYVEVPGGFSIPNWFWWLLAILGILLAAFFFFRRRKRKREEAKELPPYEEAIFQLKKLDEDHLLEQREVKEYYSRLTFAARKFIDRKLYDRALESTTSELVAWLELKRQAGELQLDDKTINNLKLILQRADLAKFANSRPDVITAKDDRKKVEFIINDVKTAAPEVSEEEKLRDEAYRLEREREKKRKRIIYAVGAVAIVVLISLGSLIYIKGPGYLKESLIGHPTKELLEGDWIRSAYGNPPVTITTPRVLKRTELELSREVRQALLGSESFAYGSLASNFYSLVTTVNLSAESKFDLEKAVEGIYENLEQQGARNIIMKEEEFTTLNGAKGIRVFGTLEMENPVTGRPQQNEYSILNFGESGGFQQITVVYEQGDEYAEKIARRIIDSVELRNTED